MTHRRVAKAALLAWLVVIPMTACGRTSAPGRGAVGRSALPALDWKQCDNGFQCAILAAPLDEADPAGQTIGVAMVRRPASDPSHRTGALFMNPGGPGGSAVELVEEVAASLPEAVRDHFDIVGMDPRGVGRSEPLDCNQPVKAMYGVDPTIDDAEDARVLLAASRRFVAACKTSDGPRLAHLGTPDVARDMDLARRAMGDRQLSFFAYSYGTVIGQVYAELFPTRVRAMVLDGVVDLRQSGVASALVQAEGFERALTAFARDCRRQPACPIGGDPIGAVDRVTATAERAAIVAPAGDRPAGPAEVQLALIGALYQRADWPNLALALADADGGAPDGSRLVALADRYLGLAEFPPYFATSCLDAHWPGPTALFAAAKRAARAAPHFGEAVTTDYVRCSLWPVKARPLTAPTETTVAAVAPIVVVSTTGDPATPYRSGVEVAKVFPAASLITHVGDSHTAALRGDACIDGPVADYLVALTRPPAGLRCD